MLTRQNNNSNRSIARQRRERRRFSNRLARRAARKRERKKLSVAKVLYDAALLDLLVSRHYIEDSQTTNRELVDKAITQALRDLVHSSENI